MANNPYVNKVIYGNRTLIDISDSTATAADVASGKYFYTADGAKTAGTAVGGSMIIRDEPDSHGGTIRHIEAVDVISGTLEISENGVYDVSHYANADVDVPAPAPTLQAKTKNYTPSETAQSETISADSGYDGLSSVNVNVGAISTTYVGSGIERKTSSDLTVSGATITAPAGYYADSASKSVASGTAGTPTATKGTVSNHSISVTPSVTNTTGYISGGTKTGTAVSVAASELVSGTYNVSASGTADVTNYASISVPAQTLPTAASSTSSGTRKATISRSTSNQYINIPTGYNGSAAYYQVSAVANGTEGTPTATKGTVSNHSISVTPSVTNTAGYISGSTKTGTAVTVSASELVSGTKSIAANGTGIDVTNYASVNVSVDAPTPVLETVTKSYTPTESQQTDTITPGSGYDGIGEVDVTIDAISSTYVGSGIARKSSSDMTVSGATVTAPAGYYASAGSKSVSSMTLPTTAASSSSGTRKATIASSTSTQYINIPAGYNSAAAYYQLSAPAAMTLPTSASSTSSGTSKATISRSTSDQYINIPTGYNSAAAYYKVSAVANGTEGTPTATKGTVSNHAISVTPSVTNTAGYISGGTKTGTAVSVSASELVSGTLTISSSGTKDVTNYASASVADGTVNSPTATKGTVSNNSISIVPSVSYTAGYIGSATKNGSAVTVTASELVSGNKEITENGTNIDVTNYATISVEVDSMPIGSISMFAGTTAPTGYLLCQGQAVSRTTYANLFTVIGTTYGSGNGSSTFNLPDLQGKFALGKSSSYALASTGGAATVTLTAAQSGIPAHAHGLNSHKHTYAKANTPTGSTTLTTDQIPAHTHGSKSLTGEASAWSDTGLIGGTASTSGILSRTGSYSYGPDWANAAAGRLKIDASHEHDSVGGGQGHTHTISTTSTDSGAASGNTADNTATAASSAHENMPPYQTVNYIIKY